jgi:glycosyltransferase involved in cell wall biosynthesis
VTRRSVLQIFEPLEGGVPEHVLRLAIGLPAHGWEVEVAAPAATPFIAPLQDSGVCVHPLPIARAFGASDVRAARALRRLDKSRSFIVVHAHSSKAGVFARAALPDRRRLVYTPHCFSFLAGFRGVKRHAYRAIEQALVPRTAALIAASNWERDQTREHLRGAAARTRVIKYGVPGCDGAAPRKELLAFKGGHPLAGLISRLEPQKDPMAIVRAAAILRARGIDNLRFAIVGNGALWDPLKAEIERLDLSDKVRLFPFRGGVQSYLRALDLFVLPSLWESLPISVLEAMACRVPVLASEVCGTPEAISDGVNGRLVPPGDPETLAAALEELVSDRRRLEELGEAGFESMGRDFTLDRMVRQTAAVYEAVLTGALPGRLG